jgi:hypothetical protein
MQEMSFTEDVLNEIAKYEDQISSDFLENDDNLDPFKGFHNEGED